MSSRQDYKLKLQVFRTKAHAVLAVSNPIPIPRWEEVVVVVLQGCVVSLALQLYVQIITTREHLMSSSKLSVRNDFMQEGFSRLWRGTNASLALAVPTVGIYMPCYDYFRNVMEDFTAEKSPSLTPYVPLVAGTIARSLACISIYPVELARTRMQAFKGTQRGVKLPGVWKTLVDAVNPVKGSSSNGQNYRMLWTGLGAQLARDVPFSAICWSILEPTRRSILSYMGEEPKAGSIIGANFTAGFVAGAVAAAATCPLDVAKTRRQIEKDRDRAMKMTTRQTLAEIWRDGGMRGMFSGAGARVGRAGPSVAIVVSFYEVVKYGLHHFHQQQ